MQFKIQFILPVFLFLFSCHADNKKNAVEKWKSEILETEQNFAAMAQEEGIQKAFLAYVADDVVLMRSNKLVIGKKEITKYFAKNISESKDESLIWKPDFVDVAVSGDLGYTYGCYTYSFTDSTGIKTENKGVFHTVWKRQADNTWRFVWD